MGVKVTISDVEDKETNANENNIILTEFSITDCIGVTEDIQGKNEFLSRNIYGIKIKGKYSISDKSKECKDVNKIFQWYKKVAHQKDTYKKIVVEYLDNNNVVYDTITFEKAFVVEYKETCMHTKGALEYFAFIRKFDNSEMAIKQ